MSLHPLFDGEDGPLLNSLAEAIHISENYLTTTLHKVAWMELYSQCPLTTSLPVQTAPVEILKNILPKHGLIYTARPMISQP